MKNLGVIVSFLFFCTGCTTYEAIKFINERNGPGVDSPEFHAALEVTAEESLLVIAKPANWHGNSYGFDDIDDIRINDAAGVLAITEKDVIFFVWGEVEYMPIKTIPRGDLGDVVVAAKGKSRRLILVSGEDHNTFEIIQGGRWLLDVEGTEAMAEILIQPSSDQ